MKANSIRLGCLYAFCAVGLLLTVGCSDNPVQSQTADQTPILATSAKIPASELEPAIEYSTPVPNPCVQGTCSCAENKTGDLVFVNSSKSITYGIYLDGKYLISLQGGGQFTRTVSTGNHKIQFRLNPRQISDITTLNVGTCSTVNVYCCGYRINAPVQRPQN